MRKPGVEDERLSLAEGIDNAMKEPNEKCGVEVHRTGGVEQHDKPQRLDLTPAPGKVDRRAPMRNVAMDCAPQIEAPPTPMDTVAADQSGAHDAREPPGERMHLGNVR